MGTHYVALCDWWAYGQSEQAGYEPKIARGELVTLDRDPNWIVRADGIMFPRKDLPLAEVLPGSLLPLYYEHDAEGCVTRGYDPTGDREIADLEDETLAMLHLYGGGNYPYRETRRIRWREIKEHNDDDYQ